MPCHVYVPPSISYEFILSLACKCFELKLILLKYIIIYYFQDINNFYILNPSLKYKPLPIFKSQIEGNYAIGNS